MVQWPPEYRHWAQSQRLLVRGAERASAPAASNARLLVINARSTEMDRWGRSMRYEYGQEIAALQRLDAKELQDAHNVVIVVGSDGLDRARHGALMQAAAATLINSGHAGKVNSGLLAVWPGANTQGAFDLGNRVWVLLLAEMWRERWGVSA